MKRTFLVLVVLASLATQARSTEKQVADKRPAAWQIPAAGEDLPLRIGGQGWFGDMKGRIQAQSIDAVVIWNRALTDEEIAILYNNGNGVAITVRK